MTRSDPGRRCLLALAALALAPVAHPRTAELDVAGLGWFDNLVARRQLDLLLDAQPGAPLDANLVEDAALILFSAQREEGYLDLTLVVDATLADGRRVRHPLDPDLAQPLPRPFVATAATLRVEPGRRFVLREVTFPGLTAIAEKEAVSFFIGQGLLIPLAAERVYSPGRLERSRANLEEQLHRLGYADATVTVSTVDIDRATGSVRARLTVDEGRLWRVVERRFVITDGSAPPPGDVGGLAGRPWSPLWRQDAQASIRRWYYTRGHLDVRVTLTPAAVDAADGTKAVTVVAQVTPGPAVVLGAVRFAGNTHTREQTLRRFVPAGRGDVLNPVAFDEMHGRLARLNAFRNVTLAYEPPGATTRDAVFTVTEGRRQEVSLLAGYGSYEQLRGGLEWRHNNLFGRAHTSSARLVQSFKSSQGDWVYTVPEMFGSMTDGSVRLFGQRREELALTRAEYGANLSFLWPLRRRGWSLTTGYSFRHLSNTRNELATSPTDDDSINAASINLGVVRDRRDNPLLPRRGYRLSLQADSASRWFGGQTDYQQYVAAFSYHTGWGRGRWIHAGLSHGVVTTFGAADDRLVPVNVRFYPGGDGSIRGYQQGEAAPRDSAGDFIGAKSYVQGNLEFEQAIAGKWLGVVFVDALGATARLSEYPFAGVLWSAGVGLRYQTLIGPIRLEYGRNLNPRPADPSGTLHFSIGFPF